MCPTFCNPNCRNITTTTVVNEVTTVFEIESLFTLENDLDNPELMDEEYEKLQVKLIEIYEEIDRGIDRFQLNCKHINKVYFNKKKRWTCPDCGYVY